MTYLISVLPGDGIGPEVVKAALLVLEAASQRFGFSYHLEEAPVGGAAIDALGSPLPEQTIEICRRSHAVLMGPVGGPKWDDLPVAQRPEQGLFGMRTALSLYANLRPAIVHKELRASSPLKDQLLGDGLDFLIVRELTGGIYFSSRGRLEVNGIPAAFDTEMYTEKEIERVAHIAFAAAQRRRKCLCSVDKANVLESSRLWRETVQRISLSYPEVELRHMYVDNAALQLLREPSQFDVILTSNMFGDILTDEAAQISGSIGLLPSASLGDGKLGMYEPFHGSAPDIAGLNKANPLATIFCVSMMLRYSLDRADVADAIGRAVTMVLKSGARTADLSGGSEILGTKEMGERVAATLVAEVSP